ncbi:MAG: hypothetical protein ABIH20_04390 [Candidatus Diapherotrites archaeon]
MKPETEEAIEQIPRELDKLTRIISIIGETLFNTKIKKLKENQEQFEELVKKKEQ